MSTPVDRNSLRPQPTPTPTPSAATQTATPVPVGGTEAKGSLINQLRQTATATPFQLDGFGPASRTAGGVVDPRQLQTVVPGGGDVAQLFGFGEGKNDREKFIDATAEFRAVGGQVRRLQAELAGIPKSDPRYAQVEAQFKSAEQSLQSKFGYTAQTLPKAGATWVDPQFLGGELSAGKMTSENFPTGRPVTQPPAAMDQALRDGVLELQMHDGRKVTVTSPEQYRAVIAENRAALGMPRTDGDPIGAHLTFQGGGGKGKRYGAAVAELYAQGVVPTSVSGASAGAIAAAMVAGGADPVQLQKIVTHPQLSKLYDLDLGDVQGGVLNGNAAYEFIDQQLRELTGIHDRPVTFADLKVPLQVVATKMSDSHPEPGTEDMTQLKNRLFVFSQETTPDTPVALAIRASMAIPGVFDPVQMVDPTTGREVQLTDGGVLDNLPMGLNRADLPVIGMSLGSQADNHPSGKTARPKPMPEGNIDVGNLAKNGYWGYKMNKDSAANVDDWRNRTQPQPGQFMLTVPTWNLENPKEGNSTLGFGWDPKVDPKLDQQGRKVTQDFLREFMDDFGKPGASGSNLHTKVPDNLHFSLEVKTRGKTYVATYSGGDKVQFQEKGGRDKFDVKLGKDKVEAFYLDHMSFGDLAPKLGKAAEDSWSWWDQIRGGHVPKINLPELPF